MLLNRLYVANFKVFFKIFILLNLFWMNLTITYAEDLLEIYYLAKDNDPIVLGARQTQLAETEQLVIARAKFLPSISFENNSIYANSTNPLLQKYSTNSYSLNISQPLFQAVDWMVYTATKKQVLSSLKKYEDIEQQLLLRVSEQYFAVLAAMDALQTSKTATQAFTKRLEQSTQQFKVGVTAITDVNEAQARLDTARANEISDANSLNTAKEKLSQIVGKFIDKVAPLKAQIPLLPPDPDNLELWIEKARMYNIQLQAARYDVETARESAKAAASKHLPTVNLNGIVSKTKDAPPMSAHNTNKQISIELKFPIFNGGASVANAQAAIFKTNAAMQALEAAYRAVESSTRVAYHTVLTQISQVDALQQSVKSSTVALKATQAAFDVGTRTIVDVLNSQTDLLNAQKNYARSRYEYIIGGLKLKQATGSLSLIDLEHINDLLEKPKEPQEKCS